METTTKPSRRWQPPRVTSTTSLQLDHLVPLDATSWCNTLESHSLAIESYSCKHKWIRGIQAHLHKPPRLKGAQQWAQGWPRLLFIVSWTNRTVTPSLGKKRGDRNRLCNWPDSQM
jgi:hypothetical protein